jgi:hypothetical protein
LSNTGRRCMVEDDLGSSMKMEFTEQKDVKQALHEVEIDLRVFRNHIAGFARRMRKNFPETAAGLDGTASALSKLSLGLDGEWRTLGNEELRKRLNSPNFGVHMWVYQLTRDPSMAVALLGVLTAIAASDPQLPFFDVLIEAKEVFAKGVA